LTWFGNSLGDVTSTTAFAIAPNGAGTLASCDNTAKTCTSTAVGTYTVTGADSGKTGTATLIITGVAPAFTADSPPTTATVATAHSYTFAATGNPVPAFVLASGSLPPGLSLNATTGGLSGTPTTCGASTFTVRAING
jgi:hypothetical protein